MIHGELDRVRELELEDERVFADERGKAGRGSKGKVGWLREEGEGLGGQGDEGGLRVRRDSRARMQEAERTVT